MSTSEISRRTALLCTGAACVSAAAGCSAYGKSTTAPAPQSPAAQATSAQQPPAGSASGAAPSGQTQAPAKPAVAAIAALADVPVGGGKILTDKQIVLTQPTAGVVKAFTAVCTHQGCVVAEVQGGTINCPCHGSKFHIADGSVAHGPAASPLAPIAVKVDGTAISLA